MKRIGLLAGVGRLPVDFARAARGMGIAVIAVGLVPGVDTDLAGESAGYHEIAAGQLAEIIALLKKENVQEITLLGKVTKELLFSGGVQLDPQALAVLAALPNQNDDTIMLGFVKAFAAAGIGVLDQTALLKALMPKAGVLSRRVPTEQEKLDVEYGCAMAKAMGGLDIGQTVVVKNRAVMAVEAIEGTDACIRRGGQLGKQGAVVVKMAKPGQDLRFDVPGAGPDTIQAMIDAGASVLAVEAGKTLLVDRERVISMADAHDIAVIAVEEFLSDK